MTDLGFHVLATHRGVPIGDDGPEVCIAFPFAAMCWRIERFTPFAARALAQTILDAASNANLNLTAELGCPDVRPAREVCSP